MTLSEMSDILVWGVVTAYTLAMIAFAVDMARLSSEKTAEKEAAMVGASVTEGAPAAARPTPAKQAVWDQGLTGRRSKALGISMATTWLGAIMHLIAIITRGVAAGRAPWANMYEFSLVGSFVAVAVFLIVQLRRDIRFIGLIVTMLSVAALVLAVNQYHVAATGVQPALQSYWLIIHVGIAIAATGVFTVAFAVSVLQLLRDSRDNGSPFLNGMGLTVRGRTIPAKFDFAWLDTIPNPVSLEALSFRLNAVGFVMWTFTLIGGSIWAEDAWGRYWGWDPKEVWTFVVWVVYAAYLHARTTRGWSGRRAAYFVLVGYGCVLFNFTGVNLLFTGKHAYSGLGK